MKQSSPFSADDDINNYIKDDDLNKLIRRARDYQLFGFSSFSHGNLSDIPKLQTVIISCIDCRLLIEKLFNLEVGEVLIIRTAGTIIDISVIRSLIISIYKLGVDKIVLLGHKDCTITDSDLRKMESNIYVKTGMPIEKFTEKIHNSSDFRTFIRSIKDPIQNLQLQLKKLYLMKESGVIPDNVIITCYLYDEKEGKIDQIKFNTD